MYLKQFHGCLLIQLHYGCLFSKDKKPAPGKQGALPDSQDRDSIACIFGFGKRDIPTTQYGAVPRSNAAKEKQLAGTPQQEAGLVLVLLGCCPVTAWNGPWNPDTCFKNREYIFLISVLVICFEQVTESIYKDPQSLIQCSVARPVLEFTLFWVLDNMQHIYTFYFACEAAPVIKQIQLINNSAAKYMQSHRSNTFRP